MKMKKLQNETWKYQTEEIQEEILSPFSKALMQMTDATTNTGLDVRTIEPEASYIQCLAPSIQRP